MDKGVHPETLTPMLSCRGLMALHATQVTLLEPPPPM